jgi:arabinofuranan 3-O-arabinosyltransferase
VTWARHNPTEFAGAVAAGGSTTLALAESAASGWRLTGVEGAQKVTLQGWMAGWRLPRGGEVTLRYTPARISRYALYLLPVTALAAVLAMYAGLRRSRRRR